MKQLSLEQKAKRYDELLIKLQEAKVDNNVCNERYCCVIDNIVPELNESEDERIRKALIENFKWFCGDFPETTKWGMDDDHNLLVKDILAWLEKQGDEKPADKVEPKFKIGDWITNGLANPEQIISIEDDMYYAHSSIDNDIELGGDIKSIDKEYHLWNISDAKDGDVLVDAYGNIGVCEKTDSSYWTSYCFMWESGVFADFGAMHENDKTYPATKEQRDTLFKAMADEGYEFDFETKKLNRIRIK